VACACGVSAYVDRTEARDRFSNTFLLLKCADLALYKVKRDGRTCIRFFCRTWMGHDGSVFISNT